MKPFLTVLGVYAAMSVVAFCAYGLDKRKARRGEWRVREATLHWIELLGGWPGALAAQRVFRHKTIDPGFRWVFRVIVTIHAIGWGIAAWMVFR